MSASPTCEISVVVHPEGVVISVRYAPCVKEKVKLQIFSGVLFPLKHLVKLAFLYFRMACTPFSFQEKEKP